MSHIMSNMTEQVSFMDGTLGTCHIELGHPISNDIVKVGALRHHCEVVGQICRCAHRVSNAHRARSFDGPHCAEA